MSGKASRAGRARLGAIGFTVISVLLALAAAFVLAKLLKGKGLKAEDMTQIVVAKQDLEPGVPITKDDVELRDWPKSSRDEERHFSSVDELMESGNLVPFQNILVGEPIMRRRLSNSKDAAGIAPLVEDDMRAFPVEIPRWVAKSKMLYPGAFVDVTATVKLKKGGYITKTAIRRAKVLSVDGAVDGVAYLKSKKSDKKKKKRQSARGSSAVTLMVSPDDAEVLAFVTKVGEVNLLLRGLTAKEDESADKKNSDEGAETEQVTFIDVIDVFGIPHEEIDVTDDEGKKEQTRPSTAATRAAAASSNRSVRRRNNKRRYRFRSSAKNRGRKKEERKDDEFTVGKPNQ